MAFYVEGLDEAIRGLERFPYLVEEEATPALRQMGEAVRGQVAVYPAQVRIPVVFASDRQRAYVHWALRNGQMEVPYRRGGSPGSERLRSSWTVQVEGAGLARRAVVGTRASYAALVQGPAGAQAARHGQAGHMRLDEAVEQARGTIERVLTEMVRRVLARL